MISAKIIKFAVIISFVALIFHGSCKDTVTTPETGAKPVIWVNPFQITFVASETGADPTDQILQVKNTGVGTLSYTIEDDASFYAVDWLSIDPPTGVSSGDINEHKIIVKKSGMSARTNEYTAKISVKSVEAYNNPQQVDVSLKLIEKEPAEMKVSTAQLSFNGREGGPNPEKKSFTIENTGEANLDYVVSTEASWLSIKPKTGRVPEGESKTHNAEADISGLDQGDYSGTITITDPNAMNNPQTILVNLSITQEAPPEIGVNTTSFSFNATVGGSNPASQTLRISNTGDGKLNYQITTDAPWLNVSPTSGTTAAAARNHTVSVNIAGLGQGTRNGTITITDPYASNSPRRVSVTLRLTTVTPPSTDNEIYVTINPSTGGTGTTVTVTISIRGNTSVIDAFGLDLTFPGNMFQFVNYSRGTLTGGFASVAANSPSAGLVKIGGFGGTSSIPVGRSGSLIVIQLRVTCSGCSDGQQGQILMQNLTDDISGMTRSPASRWFTFDN